MYKLVTRVFGLERGVLFLSGRGFTGRSGRRRGPGTRANGRALETEQ